MYLGKYLVYLDNQITVFLKISIHSVSTDISNVEFFVDMLEKILMVIMMINTVGATFGGIVMQKGQQRII